MMLGGARLRTGTQVLSVFAALVLGATMGALASVHGASASTPGGDRARIAALEKQIAADGAAAKRVVARYDDAQARQAEIARRLVVAGRELTIGRAAKAQVGRKLRRMAVEAYVNADAGGGFALLLDVPNDQSGVAAVYSRVASDQLVTTVTTYESDEHRVEAEQSTLRSEQVAIKAVLAELLPDRAAAEAAVSRDEALLGSLRGDLRRAIAADVASDAAQDSAAENAFAKKPTVVPNPTSEPTPPPVATRPSGPSGYVNPLRSISSLYPERIDQGVDYSGFGPIYAIGDGTVLSTANGGWPGGTYITYRLSNGPAAGLVVYAAEDIEPLVQVGETVTPNTVLGTVYEGPDGIETGWADNGTGDTMARDAGEFYGWNSTAFGANFSQLLVSLGAPGGVPQNHPFTGVLPADWPTW
jgi:murein DD-endopeptidase MepM/ murein hydrolase activator NlpD